MRRSHVVLVTAVALIGAGCGAVPDDGTSGRPSPTASSSVLACPTGSAPGPGATSQIRPQLPNQPLLVAMDPTGPRLIAGQTAFVPEGAGTATLQSTWAFDLCGNAWTDLGAAGLAAQSAGRPALGQIVGDAAAGVVVGLPVGLDPVWLLDPTTDTWRAQDVAGGGSDMARPTVAYDPGGDRLLAYDPNSPGSGGTATGVLALRLEQGSWTALEPDGDPDGPVPQAQMNPYSTAFDSRANQLVLVVTPSGSTGTGQTWRFDPEARTWSRGADVPQTLPNGYPADGFATAFDPESARTWLFADTAMLGYDAVADDWVVAERGAGWPEPLTVGATAVDPVARVGHGMVADPASGRLLVVAGAVRPTGTPVGGSAVGAALVATDDIWAYQPAANTWTMLLAPSPAPASHGPG